MNANTPKPCIEIGMRYVDSDGWCWSVADGTIQIVDGAVDTDFELIPDEYTHWLPMNLPEPPKQ